MNILFIAPRLPVPADTGGKIRTLNILKQLAKIAQVHLICFTFDEVDQKFSQDLKMKNIEVTLVPGKELSVVDKIRQVLFNPLPVSIGKYYSDEMESALRELNETNQFDAIHVDHLHMAHYLECFDGTPCIMDEHNVEYRILERCADVEKSFIKKMVFKNQARKMKKFEADRIQKFSSYLAVSEDDKNLLNQLDSTRGNGHVIPNGVDTEYFSLPIKGEVASEQEEAVVLTGSMDWFPNNDAALYFCKDILPLVWEKNPKVKFYIVGKDPSSYLKELSKSEKRIILTGRVDDVRVYVDRSKIFVVPLRIGGGTRLKILEAMSMNKVVISTRIGAEGIEHTNGKDIILTDTPQDFADQIIYLLSDKQKRKALEYAGRDLVLNVYDWDIIGKTLGGIYGKVTKK